MELLIITNNPKVNEAITDSNESCFRGISVDFDVEYSQTEVLIRARDMIHLGAKLVMHPMMAASNPTRHHINRCFWKFRRNVRR